MPRTGGGLGPRASRGGRGEAPRPRRRRSALGSKRVVGTDADGRDVWEVAVSSGYRADGRQRRVSRRVHGTERDADTALGALAVEMGRSPHVGDSMTLGGYWEAYYRPSLDELAHATAEGYEAAWRNHVGPRFATRDMASISRVEVRGWLLSIRAPSARRNAMKLLRQVLNAAMDDELLDAHPLMRPVRLPQPRRERVRLWGAEEVMACVGHMRRDPRMSRFLPPVLLMAGGGLRREEAVAAERADCAWVADADGGCVCLVSVERAYTPRDGYKETKTAQSRRVVAIPDPFASMLDETLPECGPAVWPRALARSWRPYDPDVMSKAWHSMFSCHGGALDLPYITINQLRATHETLMQRAGVEDSVLSSFHGHSQISTDYRHYLSPDVGTYIDAARLFGESLSGP